MNNTEAHEIYSKVVEQLEKGAINYRKLKSENCLRMSGETFKLKIRGFVQKIDQLKCQKQLIPIIIEQFLSNHEHIIISSEYDEGMKIALESLRGYISKRKIKDLINERLEDLKKVYENSNDKQCLNFLERNCQLLKLVFECKESQIYNIKKHDVYKQILKTLK
jgi:chorismate mutase